MNVKNLLALICSLGFVVFHLLVDSHYRPNADDFAGMFYASQGLPGIGYASRFYMEWEGPFLSMIVQGLWMRALYVGIPGGIIITTIKVLFLLSSVYAFSGLLQFLNGRKNLAVAVIAASVTTTTLYLISSSHDEIWHWVMGTVVYVHPQIALMLAFGLLLRKKFMLALLPLAYIMQSRATYAVLFLGLFTLITAISWIYKSSWRKSITLANVFLLLCFLVYLLAPGNANRMSPEGFDFAHYLHEYKREVKNVLLSFNIAKLDRILIGVLAIIPMLPNAKVLDRLPNKLWIATPALAYLGFVLIHAAIFVYATGYGAWHRVISMHTLLFFIVCLFYAYTTYHWLLNNQLKQKIERFTVPLAAILLMFKMYQPISNQLKSGKAFAEAYDARSEVIFSFSGGVSDTLYVNALPKPGVLHYWELSEDVGNWINDDFRVRYDIPFQVALRKEETHD